MQQYSLQPEKCWEIRHATQIDSSRSREYSASVTTYQDFFAATDAVWDALMFYEEIAEDRPFLLRRFLPTPIGSQGCKSTVGGEVKCQYVGGHLVKRATRIVREAELCVRDCRTKSRLARDKAARRRLHIAHHVEGLHPSRAGNSLRESELSSLAVRPS